VRGQGILTLIVGLAAFVFYGLIGLPYTLVLAIIAGIMELVPIVGPTLGAIPALLVALTIDPGKAIWVILATIVIQTAESIWLVPRIMTNSLGVNPIIILLSIVTFSAVFGFAGALLAIPIAAIIQLIFERLIFKAYGSEQVVLPDEIGLQTLIGRSRATARLIAEACNTQESSLFKEQEHVRVEISSIAQDLDELLAQIKREDEV
jgi:predicted PurR-regulated permease PerM